MISFAYPAPPTSAATMTFFGTTVADPYRPLENGTAPETKRWLEQEARLTDAALGALPQRERIRAAYARLIALPPLARTVDAACYH